MATRTAGAVHLRLYLEIGDTDYIVTRMDPGFHHKAIELRKRSGESYHVVQAGNGSHECDCPHFIFRDEPCKHIVSAVAFGLLDPDDRGGRDGR